MTRFSSVLVALAVACARQTDAPAPAASTSAAPGDVPKKPAAPVPLHLGPTPRPEPEERKRAAVDFLSGDPRAEQLPVIATEPGLSFDPSLRDRISPRQGEPRIVLQPPKVEGGLSSPIIVRVLRRTSIAMRTCYDEARKKAPDLGGRIELEIDVNESGAVTRTATRGARIGDATMVACVERMVRGARFPSAEGKGAAKIVAPFVFTPK